MAKKNKYVLVNGVRMVWDENLKRALEIKKPSAEELLELNVRKAKELAPEEHEEVEAPAEVPVEEPKKVVKKKASKKVSKKAPAKVEEGLADL